MPILRAVMFKNAFIRFAMVTLSSFSLVCCGGGGGGGSSAAKKGIDAGNLIPEKASDFELETSFMGVELDFDCENVTFTHSGHSSGKCPGNCEGTLSTSSSIIIEARDGEGSWKRREYSKVSGSWSVRFNGDYYVISFTDLKENGTTSIGNVTVHFRANSVTEGAERIVFGEVIGGKADVSGYNLALSGPATIKTQPDSSK